MDNISLAQQAQGVLSKMRVELSEPVRYQLMLDGAPCVELNPLLGKRVRIEFEGQINCLGCGRKSNKSFNQGYCYPCFKRLPQCDSCIVKPETCHFSEGTCRDESWGLKHCFQPHLVYLANSSGIKVGITRAEQVPTRWIDQGAVQALPIFRVADRKTSGLVEKIFAAQVSDKTNWRAMLKGGIPEIDLCAERDRLLLLCAAELEALRETLGPGQIETVDADPLEISYPVVNYPTKVVSLNLDKQPQIEGVLLGIKGQYLMFDTGVINLRKFGAYSIKLFA